MIQLTKKELRQQFRNLRDAMSESIREKESINVYEQLIQTEQYKQAEAIYSFLSYGSEINTKPILEAAEKDNKLIALPRILGKQMLFIGVSKDTVFHKNRFGIWEPEGDEVKPEQFSHTLLLLPGLCYDRNNGRIGYGGGYYDRYMDQCHDLKKISMIAPALSCQYYDGIIPMEAHDIRPEQVIYPMMKNGMEHYEYK